MPGSQVVQYRNKTAGQSQVWWTLSGHEVGKVPGHFTGEERTAKLVENGVILTKKVHLKVFGEHR